MIKWDFLADEMKREGYQLIGPVEEPIFNNEYIGIDISDERTVILPQHSTGLKFRTEIPSNLLDTATVIKLAKIYTGIVEGVGK